VAEDLDVGRVLLDLGAGIDLGGAGVFADLSAHPTDYLALFARGEFGYLYTGEMDAKAIAGLRLRF
jgi:hypothetical protein